MCEANICQFIAMEERSKGLKQKRSSLMGARRASNTSFCATCRGQKRKKAEKFIARKICILITIKELSGSDVDANGVFNLMRNLMGLAAGLDS